MTQMSDNLLTYKGYYGSFEVSVEDDLIFGKILFIDDSVGFDSETIKGIKPAFEEAVDAYLEFCKEIGKDPNPSYSGKTAIRFDRELHRKVALLAKKEDQSMNDFIVTAIKNHVECVEKGTHQLSSINKYISGKLQKIVFDTRDESIQQTVLIESSNKISKQVEGKGVQNVTFC